MFGGHKRFADDVEEGLPSESPLLFRLHYNSEIKYLLMITESLCRSVLEVDATVATAVDGEATQSLTIIDELSDKVPAGLDVVDLAERMTEDPSPYLNVLCQVLGKKWINGAGHRSYYCGLTMRCG